jgi:uncharacterized membrane protein
MTAPTGPGPAGAPTPTGGSGFPDHLAGTLAYVLGAITGILFFMLDRHRPFVRFHALQAIGLTIVWIGLSLGLTVLGFILTVVPVLGWLVDVLLALALSLMGFVLWIWLMVQAWRGNQWEVPVLGPQIRRLADRVEVTPAPPGRAS